MEKDAASFDALCAESYPKVYRLALGLAGNRHDAEEITQETFLRAVRSWDGFRGECSFFTWVYRIALNVSNGRLRYRAKTPAAAITEDYGWRMEDVLDLNPQNNPETELLSREVRFRCLRGMTECLSADQRRVFCLAVTLGLPHRTVADILECTPGRVRTTLYRARKRWFGYMSGHCGLLDPKNPCRCAHWVRFARTQGWLTAPEALAAMPDLDQEAMASARRLKVLSMLYASQFPEDPDTALAERIREGMRSGEWKILS
jgi:RNA polymerase sigma-70 factor, ECF subfamily